jgi:ceramide glucosyltransferase
VPLDRLLVGQLAALALVYAVVVVEIGRRAALLAWRGVRERRARVAGSASRAEPIVARDALVLRPVKGGEPWLAENLAEPVRYPGARECFSVGGVGEDAHALVMRAASERRGVEVSAGELPLPNPKVAHLAYAYAYASQPPCDVVAVVDADVDPRTVDGAAIVRALEEPAVDAVWQPVVEGPGETFGDAISEAILLGSFHAFPLLGLLDRGGLVGKVSAVRRRALDDVGGFAALGHVLGEDMELAAAIREHGCETRMLATVARSSVRGRRVREVFDRFVRWTLVTKSQRPAKLATYPLFFFPVPLVAIGAGCTEWPEARFALAVALLARASLVLVGALRANTPSRIPRVLLLALPADLLLLAAWVRALASSGVVWRGTRMRFGPRGRLERAQ